MTKDKFGFPESDDARRADPAGCARAADLVAYLYDEASAGDKKSFELHMSACAACREELSSFRGVRQMVSEWRAEALSAAPEAMNAAPSVAFPASVARLSDASTSDESIAARADAAGRKRSAVAALREFFALSPAWLRAASVAAALAVCALTALTLARTEVRWGDGGLAFRTGVPERVVERRVEVAVPTGFTQEQVDELAARRVEQALAEYRAKVDAGRGEELVNASDDNKGVTRRPESSRPESSSGGASRSKQSRRASPAPRRDKPVLAGLERDDDDLPRLSDLLSVAN